VLRVGVVLRRRHARPTAERRRQQRRQLVRAPQPERAQQRAAGRVRGGDPHARVVCLRRALRVVIVVVIIVGVGVCGNTVGIVGKSVIATHTTSAAIHGCDACSGGDIFGVISGGAIHRFDHGGALDVVVTTTDATVAFPCRSRL